jgi:hypothetical protein
MSMLRGLPAALEGAGVEVRVLDGWLDPHLTSNGSPYLWREINGEPAGHMHHHTATSGYTPNRIKANGYAGLGSDDSDRLYQSGGGRPIFVLANSYPAPISSGYGVRDVLESYVKNDIQFVGRQSLPNDDPKWAGNTHYFNTEWILDGVGTWIDDAVWDMMLTVNAVMCDMYGWSAYRNIGHAQHTRRKIDLRGGQFPDMAATMDALVRATKETMESGMWCNDWTDKSWMTFFDDTTIPGVEGDGRYYCSGDDTYTFSPAFGTIASDGKAAYAEKVHAINYVFSGFALALDQG